MITVKKGDVYITTYRPSTDNDINLPVKRLSLIEGISDEGLVDVIDIVFWKRSLPTLLNTTGPVSELLPFDTTGGSIVQGTSEDWFEALETVYVRVGGYSKKVIEGVKE